TSIIFWQKHVNAAACAARDSSPDFTFAGSELNRGSSPTTTGFRFVATAAASLSPNPFMNLQLPMFDTLRLRTLHVERLDQERKLIGGIVDQLRRRLPGAVARLCFNPNQHRR